MSDFGPYYTVFLIEVKRVRAWRLYAVFLWRAAATAKKEELQSKYPRNEYRVRCAQVGAPR